MLILLRAKWNSLSLCGTSLQTQVRHCNGLAPAFKGHASLQAGSQRTSFGFVCHQARAHGSPRVLAGNLGLAGVCLEHTDNMQGLTLKRRAAAVYAPSESVRRSSVRHG
jgi:hypothetical protein